MLRNGWRSQELTKPLVMCRSRRLPGREGRWVVVALAKQLRRKHLSLREISAELFTAGHTTKPGKPFTPQSIANMLD